MHKLHSTHMHMIRKLAKGLGCKKHKFDKNGVMMYSAMSDDDPCRKLGLYPVRILLRHARLRFLQKMVRNPEHHDVFLTALMGRFLFDTDPPRSNPWLD